MGRWAALVVAGLLGCDAAAPMVVTSGPPGGDGHPTAPDGDGHMTTTVCSAQGGGAGGGVAKPVLLRNLPTGQTGWFGSPAVVTDGARRVIVAGFYSLFAWDGASGEELSRGTATKGRIFAPAVVGDLDHDGVPDVVVGGEHGTVAAYQLQGGKLALKPGWPASTCSAGVCPEARAAAAGDLDRTGRQEVVVATTNGEATASTVFVYRADGTHYQPAGCPFAAWPRYNTHLGAGGDADFNGMGNHGDGSYGLNIGIGNIDDGPELEVLVGNDSHQVNAFHFDGTSVLASSWFQNPRDPFLGRRLGWGQFIRWFDPAVEEARYHTLKGPSPDIQQTMWLQWTTSPLNVVDLDGDGRNEVVGLPNAEQHEPYDTMGYAVVALSGAHGDGARSARRAPGFESFPFTGRALPHAYDDALPNAVPAPTTVNISGDARPEIVFPVGDGRIYAVGPDGKLLWSYDYARGMPYVYASEVVVADLDRDGVPELLFGVYGRAAGDGRLVILSNRGALLHDVTLAGQNESANGVGVGAAPTVADVDGDGQLEILLTTFDHGLDVLRVPGSGTSCLLWPTARGSNLRAGTGPSTAK